MYHITFTRSTAHHLIIGLSLNVTLITHCCSIPTTTYCLCSTILCITCKVLYAESNKNEIYCSLHPVVYVLFQYEHSKHATS
jgi:hypothetical protein